MDGGEPLAWKGRREPNQSLAWTIIAIGTGLLVVALYQVYFLDASVNLWFLTMLVLGLLAYAAISLSAFVEMEVTSDGETLSYTKREWSVGYEIRKDTISVERSRISKVVERNAGLGVRVVRVEDVNGRRLLTFPEFLRPDEHDAMISAIVEWGNQAPSSASGSEETPVPDSR